MQGLFYICGYFGITPQEFFDEDNKNPERLVEIINNLKKPDNKALPHIAGLVKELIAK